MYHYLTHPLPYNELIKQKKRGIKMKIINYSNRPVYADFTSRMVYRKKSFISKLIKKYHLKEVGIF